MFQGNAFQRVAFQTVIGTGANDNVQLLGGIMTPPYGYHSPYKALQESIRKQKTELQKVDSVIHEYERKKELAVISLQAAKEQKKKQTALRLAGQENQLLEEITRLLAVRAEIMRRIREEEAILIILMMKRRRLRAA